MKYFACATEADPTDADLPLFRAASLSMGKMAHSWKMHTVWVAPACIGHPGQFQNGKTRKEAIGKTTGNNASFTILARV